MDQIRGESLLEQCVIFVGFREAFFENLHFFAVDHIVLRPVHLLDVVPLFLLVLGFFVDLVPGHPK